MGSEDRDDLGDDAAPSDADDASGRERPVTRREALLALGVGGVGAVAGGFAGAVTSGDDDDGDEAPPPGDTVDVVAETGVARDGTEDLTPAVDAVAEAGAHLVLRDGVYGVGSRWDLFRREYQGLTIEGRGATLVPLDGFDGAWLRGGGPGNAMPDGVTLRGVEVRGTSGASDRMLALTRGTVRDLTLADITYPERLDCREGDAEQTLVAACSVVPGHRVDVENVNVLAGADPSLPANEGAGFLFVGNETNESGHVFVRNCDVQRMNDNAVYGSKGAPVTVIGGTYRNNDVASIRLGGAGSAAIGVRVIVDRRDVDPDAYDNPTAIWLENQGGITVSGTTLYHDFRGDAVKVTEACSSATLRDVEVVKRAPGRALRVDPYEGSIDGADTMDRVSVVGGRVRAADPGDEALPAVASNRPGTLFDDLELVTERPTGLSVTGGGTRIEGGSYQARQDALAFNTGDAAGSTVVDAAVEGAIAVESAADLDLREYTEPPTLRGFDTAVRPRWDGVIGGGPLGGVDLSAVEGQYPGDRAMSDGSVRRRGVVATWVETDLGFAWRPEDGSAPL